MKIFVLSTILMMFMNGCLEPEEFDTADAGKLIFQSEYTNYAWGYSHNGWMLDSTGVVRSFQKSAAWIFPDSIGYISEADMKKNLAACDAVVTQVSKTEFSSYAEKATTCVNGTLTKPENKMADAGAHVWAFYLYDPTRKGYKRVILDMTGDWSQQNLASNAKEIVDWMLTIK